METGETRGLPHKPSALGKLARGPFRYHPGMSERAHTYRIAGRWTGNLGQGTASYAGYSRNFELEGLGKVLTLPGSSDPQFRGDGARYNPEELLVGALSACHMLWVLHLCADVGIVVVEYTDDASGDMVEQAGGAGEFVRVILRPRMAITDAARIGDAVALHHRAGQMCFLARSMKFPVEHQPVVTAV
jgi:organic hydroperoxide reductase OsmC/OhrA